MLEIIQSATFSRWLGKLKDRAAIMRITARIRRVAETGNFGDAKAVREGVAKSASTTAQATGCTTCKLDL